MCRLNLLRELKEQDRFGCHHGLRGAERMLWHALLLLANERAERQSDGQLDFPEGYMSLSLAELSLHSGLGKQTIERARAALQQYGVLGYIPGERNRMAACYRLCYLSVEGKITPPAAPVSARAPEVAVSQTAESESEVGLCVKAAGENVPETVTMTDDKNGTGFGTKTQSKSAPLPNKPDGYPNQKDKAFERDILGIQVQGWYVSPKARAKACGLLTEKLIDAHPELKRPRLYDAVENGLFNQGLPPLDIWWIADSVEIPEEFLVEMMSVARPTARRSALLGLNCGGDEKGAPRVRYPMRQGRLLQDRSETLSKTEAGCSQRGQMRSAGSSPSYT